MEPPPAAVAEHTLVRRDSDLEHDPKMKHPSAHAPVLAEPVWERHQFR